MPVDDLSKHSLFGPGQIKPGQPIDSRTLRALATQANGRLIAGPGIMIRQSGANYVISATAQRSGGGSNGATVRVHEDVFPAIPTVVTDIELGGMYWHACDPDTVWTLDSFVFTAATGEVGTDETGGVP